MRIGAFKTLAIKPPPIQQIEPIRWPDDEQRIVVIGRTGSGKTLWALWHLSTRSFHTKPWTIIDYKRDKHVASLGAQDIDIRKDPPKYPGLYVARIFPKRDDAALEEYLWKVWERGEHGLMFDEGYQLPLRSEAIPGILTQGRSKEIPTITLIQRPAWVEPTIISETDFAVVFNLNMLPDRKTVRDKITSDISVKYRLPQYYSYYYDVGNDTLRTLQPVPDRDEIISRFEARLEQRKRRL